MAEARRTWAWYLCGGAALIGLYYLMEPLHAPELARVAVYTFLSGSATIAELQRAEHVILGRTAEWLRARTKR